MKVFISWSGEASRALAEALRDWLPLVLHYVEPWMSDVDIDAGERWADSVAKELEASNFGIICVTRENVASSWVLFEAGALAKSIKGSRVIPLLFDLDFRDISGPLAQFQAKKLEENGIGEIIQSINQAADSPLEASRAAQLFDALWPQLEEKVGEIPTDNEPAKRSRPQAEVLEELVASIRSLDGRVQAMGAPGPTKRNRVNKRRMMMQTELAHMAMEGPGDPINILTLASAFKESVPWISDLGQEAYRAVVEDSPQADYMVQRFLRSVDTALRGHLRREEMDFEPGFIEMLVHEVSRGTRSHLPTKPPAPESHVGEEEPEE